MKRIFIFLYVCALIFCATILPAHADEALGSEYKDFFEELPESVKENLPDSASGEDALSDAAALADFRYFLTVVADIFGMSLRRVLPIFFALCGLIFLAAAVSAFRDALAPHFSEILSFCTSSAIAAASVALQYETLKGAGQYILDLASLANALLPLTVSLYASGGNVAAGGVSAGAFGVFLNFCENALSKTVIPFSGICLSFAIANSVFSHIDLRPLAGAVKKTYTTVLGFLMTIFCFVLGAQSAIASGQDSISQRAVRFFAGSAIPVLGGTVSESTKAFFASVGMLRKSVGVAGIFLVLLLFLPILISLLLMRSANGIAAGIASMVGCSREANLLSEISGVYGYICGVLCISSIMLIFLLTLLINTAAAGAVG